MEIVVFVVVMVAQIGGGAHIQAGDVKVPSKDKPGEWNAVMAEAVSRLHVAHNARRLYIILNVGLEWLPFYWDPINPGNALTIKASPGHQDLPVDPGIRPTPNFPTGHIDANGFIHTNMAKTLDCFTTTTTPQGPSSLIRTIRMT